MNNILERGRKNISKVFILVLIFIGLISAFSMVSAANNKVGDVKVEYLNGKDICNDTKGKINMREGEEIIIRLPETEYGYVKSVEVTGNNKDIINYKQEGESKGSFSKKLHVKITAAELKNTKNNGIEVMKEKDTCKVTIKYIPKGISTTKTAVYDITVSKNITSFEINNQPTKTTYTVGEKVDLSGMKFYATFFYKGTNDGNRVVSMNEKNANGTNQVGLTYEPKVIAANTKKITVKYFNATKDINIVVKENKPVTPEKPTQPENNETQQKPSNEQTSTKVYTNNLKIGDKLKLKDGSGWRKYKSKSMNSAYKTITGGTTFTIEAIDKNWLTIKGETTYKYLYYGPDAVRYFSKVTSNSNSSNSSNISSTTSSAPQYIDGTAVKRDDVIKMTKGNSWNVYSANDCKTIKSYIQSGKGITYKVEDINGNIIKLSQEGKNFGYIKWYNSSTGARNYFIKVEVSNNNSSISGNNSVDANTKVESSTNTNKITVELQNAIIDLISEILTNMLKGIAQFK